MSVAFVSSCGTFVIDLYLKTSPMNSFNFLKLCKIGWFNNALFSEILEDHFIKIEHIQCKAGTTIYSLLSNEAVYIPDEISKHLTHSKAGVVSTCNFDANKNTSTFFITLGADQSKFDGKRTIFGEVSENFEMILEISKEIVDKNNRPLRNIRILQTKILYDPFPDPPGIENIDFKPFEPIKETDRLEYNESLHQTNEKEYIKEMEAIRARQNAHILELLGDLPDAEVKPSETTLFVCKLHKRTTEDGLKIIFSRFGNVKSVDLIKDKKTGESLCYAFVDFEKKEEAENAFLKMRRTIIDGKQVLVDFSQSIKGSKIKNKYKFTESSCT